MKRLFSQLMLKLSVLALRMSQVDIYREGLTQSEYEALRSLIYGAGQLALLSGYDKQSYDYMQMVLVATGAMLVALP
jgi:hypothetical protein